MQRIALLDQRLANQIAAGEVVERPASVVKELLENAIDADATRIVIDVDAGGTKLIRVSDDGHGIHSDDLNLALARHATSKISELQHLAAIESLGFRGEALASIASVSKLKLTTSTGGNAGWAAEASGAEMATSLTPAPHPRGTTVEVRDLFFNVPARRKFLRKERTEFLKIEEVVRKVSLSHAHVAFFCLTMVSRCVSTQVMKSHIGLRVFWVRHSWRMQFSSLKNAAAWNYGDGSDCPPIPDPRRTSSFSLLTVESSKIG